MYIYESIFILVLTSEIVRIAGKQMDLTRKVCPASCIDIPLMVPPTAQRWPQLGLSQKQGAEPAGWPQSKWLPPQTDRNGSGSHGFQAKELSTVEFSCITWDISRWLDSPGKDGALPHAAAVLPKLCDGNIKDGPWSAKPSLVNWTHIGIPTCSNHCQNDPGVLCCQWFDSSKVSEILLDGTEIHMTYCFFFRKTGSLSSKIEASYNLVSWKRFLKYP